MPQGLIAVQMLFYLLSGLGIFFLGIAALWFVSIHKGKKDRED